MKDTIYRDDAIKCCRNEWEEEVEERLRLLPSADACEKTCEITRKSNATDTINRQAAVDAVADYIHRVDRVIGSGTLSADDCKDVAREEQIFSIISHAMCKYRSLSKDMYLDKLESACHHGANIPDGESWGECSKDKCPFMKLFAERREQNERLKTGCD